MPDTESSITVPVEGGIYVASDGQRYRFRTVTTGLKEWDPETCEMVPGYHSLKTYFSHYTDRAGAGPGWDTRFWLRRLSKEQMLRRYGHHFTEKEIVSPGGEREYSEGGSRLVGGMPDDILYYELEPLDE